MGPRRLLPLAAALLAATCAPAPEPPSVVLVLVDQLRADAAERWMPELSALAADGVRAEEVRAAAPWTYPSVISLMSGLYPQQHGADGVRGRNVMRTFDRSVPLLPALLRDAGWRTAAFVTNPFLHDWNPFHEGFDHFDAGFIGSSGNRRGYGELVWTADMFADDVLAAVRAHYAAPPDGPEFAYVHLIDVHGPWDEAPFAPDYESAVRWTDARVAELYRFFRERHGGDLLFVVTSDHGVALGDDEAVGDGPALRKSKHSVHDFNLRVPLLVLPGDDVPAGVVLRGPASLVDVVPTLLDWLGLDAPHALPGASLLPALRGGRPLDADRPLYARETYVRASDCVVWRGRKYARFADVEAARVYDLETDPHEVAPVADDLGDAAEVLARAAGDHDLVFPTTVEDLAPETRERLEALGYLR